MNAYKSTILPASPSRWKHRRRGFSLTEIAVVLMTMGLLIAAIWVGAAQVNEKMRVNEALDELHAIARNMTSLLQGGYGANPPPICGAAANCPLPGPVVQQVVPPQWLVPGGGAPASGGFGIRNPWDAPTIAPAPATGGTMLFWGLIAPYSIAFYNASRAGCIGLLTKATNCTPGRPGCPISINTAINAGGIGICSLVTTAGNPPQCAALPLTATEIEANCDRNFTPPNGNSVEFGFNQ